MKNILKYTLLSIFTLSMSQAGWSQNKKRAKFDSLQNTIIVQKLALTQEEQDKFLPLYNDYKKKERMLIRKERKLLKQASEKKATSDEAMKILLELKRTKQQQALLYKKYQDLFLQILSPEKVLKLYTVEREIRKIVAAKLRERRK